MDFWGDQGAGVEYFSDHEGKVENLFMPHWQTFIINVIKKSYFHEKQLNWGI